MNYIKKLITCMGILIMYSGIIMANASDSPNNIVDNYEEIAITCEDTNDYIPDKPLPRETVLPEEEHYEVDITESDLYLVALVTIAEAEGESEYGKRLVIDTVLNRVDSDKFPNDIYGVVYQEGQFSSMYNGRSDRCEVTDEVCDLVMEEAMNRTNREVLYFRAGKYHSFGVPLFSHGNHYFSGI